MAARQRAGTVVDTDRVVDRARAAGVHVESLAAYATAPSPVTGLLIGYGAIPDTRIGPGWQQLAACFPREGARSVD